MTASKVTADSVRDACEGMLQQWRGEGMTVIRAESLDAARAIAAEDPMHVSGARAFEVRPWLVNEGSLTIRLNHSKRSFQLR